MANTPNRDEIVESLKAGVAELADSCAWRRWLDVQGRFHHYSFGNALLIRRQRPRATRVAGFQTWRRLGRTVRRGEKAIWILAPMRRRVVDSATTGDDEQPPTRVLRGFKAVPVFDVGQTDGEPLPSVPMERLRGEAPERVYDRLIAVARDIGYVVREARLPGERNGDCSYAERRIRIEGTNASAQQVKTLVHELAHAMLHEGSADRSLAELEAESIAYVVCTAIGIDAGACSFGYVASWAGGGDEAIAGIKASATRIQQTANHILVSIESRDEPATCPSAVSGAARSTRRLQRRAGA